MEVVKALYYTDPFCPWSWALESTLRRLMWEFSGSVRWTYVMSGMRPELEDERQLALELLEASGRSGMPVDVRLWLQDPPRSSYAACIAVKAAAEQGDPGPYLRRLREAVLCRQRKIEGADELIAEARALPQLALERFKLDLGSNAILEKFAADLDLAQGVIASHHADGLARVKLPSIEFSGADGAVHGVYGYADYTVLQDAARAAGAEPQDSPAPSVAQALRSYGSLAAAEVASVCGIPEPVASAELWRMATEWQAKPEHVGTAELWTPA